MLEFFRPPSSIIDALGITSWSGALEWLVLALLPGAWVTFGLPLRQLTFWGRFLTGITLAPLLVPLEFYVVRLLGASFELTVIVLVFLNLPALHLIAKSFASFAVPGRGSLSVWALVLFIPCACLAPQFFHLESRMYFAHSWTYTETMYVIARGDLILDDPALAGMRSAYPVWGGLVFQAVLSFLLDSPPMSSFIWTNLLWLIVIYAFAVGLATELGGSYPARFTGGIWLLFGINPIGYIGSYVLPMFAPGSFVNAYKVWGDWRYTPWVTKFQSLHTDPLGLGMFIALVYLLIRPSPTGLTRDLLVLVGLLLCGVGLIYPILFPAACGVLGAKAMSVLGEAWATRRAIPYREIFALGVPLAISVLLTFAHYEFLTRDRAIGAPVQVVTEFRGVLRRSIEVAVVTAPLLVGLAIALPRCWRNKRYQTLTLLLGGLASCSLAVLFHLPYWDNEYKYLFTAAVCLAPFPALAADVLIATLGRTRAVPILAITVLILVSAFVHKMYQWPWTVTKPHPVTAVGDFYLKLDKTERYSRLCDAVRERTPANSVLVVDSPAIHFPTLTGRSLYVQSHDVSYAGVNQGYRALTTKIKGYDSRLLSDRRSTLAGLFEGNDDRGRRQSLEGILELGRPVAIILEPRHGAVLEWLMREGIGAPIYQERDLAVWLIRSPAA